MNYQLSPEDMIKFLREASEYFKNRSTGGEDRAYWSNVMNSSKCSSIADWIETTIKGVTVR